MRSQFVMVSLLVFLAGCTAAPTPSTEGPQATPEPTVEPTPQPAEPAPEPPEPAPQPPEPTTGPDAASTRTVWDGVYTSAQAERGGTIAQSQCAICHSMQGEWPLLVNMWSGMTLREPFTLIRTTMPQHNPGSLEREEYAAVVAYILRLNGAPAGASELPSDDEALARIMVSRRE
jgi:hypothetical protein